MIDLTGRTFGRLKVISRDGYAKNGKSSLVVAWKCRCACGTEKTIGGNVLRKGATVSCGCAWADAIKNKKHGNARKKDRSPEYDTWAAMKARCTRPTHKDWHSYGGRGISVCDEWSHDFRVFLADMGKRPTPLHTIDRIDVNGPYAKWNCRWVLMSEQSKNRRPRSEWRR